MTNSHDNGSGGGGGDDDAHRHRSSQNRTMTSTSGTSSASSTPTPTSTSFGSSGRAPSQTRRSRRQEEGREEEQATYEEGREEEQTLVEQDMSGKMEADGDHEEGGHICDVVCDETVRQSMEHDATDANTETDDATLLMCGTSSISSLSSSSPSTSSMDSADSSVTRSRSSFETVLCHAATGNQELTVQGQLRSVGSQTRGVIAWCKCSQGEGGQPMLVSRRTSEPLIDLADKQTVSSQESPAVLAEA